MLTLKKLASVDTVKSYVSQFSLAPIIAWESVSKFIYAEPIEILGKIPAHCQISDNTFALMIESSVYEPVFLEGSVIGIDPDAKIKNGNYVILVSYKTKKVSFKQLFMNEDGRIYLGNITQDDKKIAKTDDDVIVGRVVFLNLDF